MDGAVGQEVVVEAGQVCAATGAELERGVDLDGDLVGRLDDIEEVFLLLLDLVPLGAEVLDDVGRAPVRRRRGDVVQRRVGC